METRAREASALGRPRSLGTSRSRSSIETGPYKTRRGRRGLFSGYDKRKATGRPNRQAPGTADCPAILVAQTHQKKLPIVNSNTLGSSYGNGANGKPHSKRSGPSGENQR